MNAKKAVRRPVTDADRAFLFGLYASLREQELARTPWTDAQKRLFLEMQFQAQTVSYAQTYPDAAHELIEVEHQPAGRIYWSNQPDGVHILDITIAPGLRNQGIGSQVLRELMEIAERERKPLSIYVESFNPSLPLFEKLGFSLAEQDGFQLLLKRVTR